MKWDWKEWIRCAGIRALKTFAQSMIGCITVGAAVSEVDWLRALSVSAVACVLSLLTSLGGLPELGTEE